MNYKKALLAGSVVAAVGMLCTMIKERVLRKILFKNERY